MAQNITLLPKGTQTITSPAAGFGAYNKRITQQTQSTYDARYPGFNESEYRKLERLAADKGVYGGDEKTQLMDQLYQYYAPQVLNIHKLDQRQKDLNQMTYENDGKEPGTTSLKLTGIAQMAKQKYGINAEVDDQQLIGDIVEGTPNGQALLQSYINKGDPEFLYASGLQDKPKVTWGEIGRTMAVKANAPIDSIKKFGQRAISNLGANIYKRLLKNVVGDEIESKTGVSVDDYVDTFINKANQESVQGYQNKVNEAYRQKEAESLTPEIQQYYNNKGYTETLSEGDLKGFALKALGDAAQNWEMPVVIAASVFNPAVGFALMGTDTYARENQEAYEQMLENGATYDQAEAGGVAVGLINAGIEVGLEKLIGGAETRASDAIRKTIFKNVRDEATKKGLREIVGNAGLEQLKASGEEGLEEVLQQIVQNAYVKAVNENQELFEGVGQAFEGGFYNPMNLLVGGGNLTANTNSQSLSDTRAQIRDSINTKIGLPSLGIANGAKNVVNGVENLGTKITDWGAKKITNTVSAQDKLYKAQEPRMNVLSKKKDLENKRARSDRANELIVENGYLPTNTAERLDAHQKTLNDLWSQVKEQVNAQEGVAVDQSSIIEKLENYINEKKQLNIAGIENDIRALERELENFKRSQENENTDLPILENKKQVYNDMIDWQGQEASEVYKGGLKLITKEIGNIEDNILSELPGEFSNLKRDVGALLDSYEDVFKADMKNQRKKGAGLTETYSRIEGVGDIVNGLAGIVTGQGNLASVAKGAAKLAVGKSLAKAKDVDFLIKQGFEELAREKGVQNNTTADNSTVVYEDIERDAPIQEMTREQQIDEEISRIMSPKEAMDIVEVAYAANNIRDMSDGEYRTASEWLEKEGADTVTLHAENTLQSQRMIESYPELLDGNYTFADVLESYLDGKLKGKGAAEVEQIDLSESTDYSPTKFYEPQEIRNAELVWDEANKRVTNSNRDAVYQARGEFVIDAHDPGFVQELGLTDKEVNKKLRDWAAYPAAAKELSNKINKDVAAQYRWAGLENSSIVKSMTVTDLDLEKMVKMVEGYSQEYQRKYISNTMLALDTHIDWSPLTFKFVRGGDLDYNENGGRTHHVAGNYNETSNTISISSAGQNTVAHEMGHYLDYLWGRQLFGVNVTLSEGGARNFETLTEDQTKFVKNFDVFMRGLKGSADKFSGYTVTPTEIFARFVARFTEWTRKTATNNRYDYETKWYDDKFVESDYIKFAKLLQQKSKLDIANEYANFEGYLERHEQRRGETKGTTLEDMMKPLPDRIMKNVKVVGEREDGGNIYEGVRGELAERLLLNEGEGMVRDAYTFKGEPVDLIWGEYDTNEKSGRGLAKISQKHPNILGKIQSLLNKLKVKEESEKKVVLGDGKYKLVLRKDYNGEKMNRVLTAYEKE